MQTPMVPAGRLPGWSYFGFPFLTEFLVQPLGCLIENKYLKLAFFVIVGWNSKPPLDYLVRNTLAK